MDTEEIVRQILENKDALDLDMIRDALNKAKGVISVTIRGEPQTFSRVIVCAHCRSEVEVRKHPKTGREVSFCFTCGAYNKFR